MTHFLSAAPLVLGLTYLLGWGTTRLLLPEGLRGWEVAFAPWIGIVQTAIVLVPFGVLGIGVGSASWAALAVGALFLGLAWYRRGIGDRLTALRLLPAIVLVLAVVTLMLAPAVRRAGGLNTFTLKNTDQFTYVLAASWVKEHGLLPLPSGPPWLATADKNIYSSLGDNPRWLSALYLSFLSSVLGLDPVRLFSLLQSFALALQLPLVWMLGREVFGLTGAGLVAGFLLAALNPYPTYVAFEGYLPQVLGTGFFLGYLVVLPTYLEEERFRWQEGTLLTLFGTGIIMSYLELVPFALLISIGYAGWTAARQGAWPRHLGRLALVAGVVALVNPFQTTRILDFLWFHVAAVSPAGFRTGWPMPGSYTELGGLLTLRPRALRLILLLAVAPLIVCGIAAPQPRRTFVILMAAPFAAAAAVAYRADYSYAFFKSLTYIYFWLPLLIGRGIMVAKAWLRRTATGKKMKRALGWVLVFTVVGVIMNEAVTTNHLRQRFSRSQRSVPLELAGLEPFNRDPRINDVFISGLNSWESIWAVYYLRDKRIGMTWSEGILSNPAGLPDDGQWRFLLRREGFRPLIDPRHRRMGTVLFRAGPFVLGPLEPTTTTGLGSLVLGRGFSGVDDYDREEWVWFGREGEIVIEWPGRFPSASLRMELSATPRQTLRVLLNGELIETIPVETGGRRTYEIPLPLVAGRNRLLLTSDREPPPSAQGNPPWRNVRVFSLNLEPRPGEPTRQPVGRPSKLDLPHN